MSTTEVLPWHRDRIADPLDVAPEELTHLVEVLEDSPDPRRKQGFRYRLGVLPARIDDGALDRAVGTRLGAHLEPTDGLRALAVDGKSLRDSRTEGHANGHHDDGRARHIRPEGTSGYWASPVGESYA
ncbi:hypothetical protein [Streptomyces sp. NBC_00057]|uniref:hypothetical protein n=1 Tax=Streptomyces sp. NBC_00057 TaxID=2975634 RepID=UPI00324DD584